MSPSSNSTVIGQTVTSVTSPVATVSWGGGAPGTPSISWAMSANPSARGALLNPLGATTQRIRVTPTGPADQVPRLYSAIATVTDSLGNSSQAIYSYTVEKGLNP